ncbi:MAG TPA: type II secretion system protein GspG, partial [bacterium]|nr:type II secretion system protein GspG [bacterium]
MPPPNRRCRWDLLGVGVLAGLLVLAVFFPSGLRSIARTTTGVAEADIGMFNSSLALYQMDVSDSQFPRTTLMQLYADSAPGWIGPYVATIANDPWGNAYTYASDGHDYTICSIHDAPSDRQETIR